MAVDKIIIGVLPWLLLLHNYNYHFTSYTDKDDFMKSIERLQDIPFLPSMKRPHDLDKSFHWPVCKHIWISLI